MATQTPPMNSHQLVGFSLPGVDGRVHDLSDLRGARGTLLMFICNHCPYVKGVIARLADDCRELMAVGVGCAAISANDVQAYPADSFDNMKLFARQHDLPFPYLFDETQSVARAYGAVCTPDLFGFDAAGFLKYRGRVDSAGAKPATGVEKRELRDAMLMVAKTGEGPAEQVPSIGCSIKWKA